MGRDRFLKSSPPPQYKNTVKVQAKVGPHFNFHTMASTAIKAEREIFLLPLKTTPFLNQIASNVKLNIYQGKRKQTCFFLILYPIWFHLFDSFTILRYRITQIYLQLTSTWSHDHGNLGYNARRINISLRKTVQDTSSIQCKNRQTSG